jgi:hypothetical protein
VTASTDLKTAVGTKIVRAQSSLRSFAAELNDGRGIILNAAEGPTISAEVVQASQLPSLSEAVCSVDWSWIATSSLEDIQISTTAVRLTLQPAGPLTISAGIWQGSPFLSFMPYKPAK